MPGEISRFFVAPRREFAPAVCARPRTPFSINTSTSVLLIPNPVIASSSSHECVHDGRLADEVDEEEAVHDGQAHQKAVEVPVRRRRRPVKWLEKTLHNLFLLM